MLTDKHRPVLIVIAGPNGSGKTTITSKILKHEWLEGALYINPDQVAQDKFGDWNSPEAVLQAAQYCEQQREECLKSGQSLIFETVLSSEGKVAFIRRAREAGYFYDNSVDNTEARLLFRMTEGCLFKRYTDDIPLWAQTIIG